MVFGIDLLFWTLLIGRVALVFFALLIAVMLAIWVERKVVADMQTRIGPNRAGPFGVLITLADGIKLFFKEGITPTTANRPVFLLAPILSLVPAFLAFAVVPFGTGVELFGREVPFQIADLDIGILWVLAMGSLAVYGVVLAGWSSGSNYPLLGSIRSSAQMISYEVGMSLGLVAVLLYSGTVVMSEIVAVQARHFEVTGLGWLPKWNIFYQLPAFLIYFTAAVAETQRPPFDLPEAETELVAGYHTEYSGIKFAMFFLAEYTHTITVSAVGVTLFLGGWHGPMFDIVSWLWPILWFMLKLVIVVFVLVWVRATLPRFRYDRLMSFGWKVLIPVGLLWVLVTAAYIQLPNSYSDGRAAWIIVAGTLGVILLIAPLYAGPPRGDLTRRADQGKAPERER
jgi:NADH-quinone oxidoreductase subunit H